jgi:hypothetical protein
MRSFHGLAYFYCQFIKNFNSIMATITECTKKGSFIWTKSAQKAFDLIKQHLTEAPILQLPFEAPLEVACDDSHLSIGGVLSQNGHPVAFYSKKLMKRRDDTLHMT